MVFSKVAHIFLTFSVYINKQIKQTLYFKIKLFLFHTSRVDATRLSFQIGGIL